jgi:arylsulfatase A-like enzyme
MCCGASVVARQAAAAETTVQSRPNIVFILADDLGWGELGSYGQEKIPTPNLDRLAAEGMRFTCHYSGAPVCAPSRCVLMTGRHLGHAEIRGNMPVRTLLPQFDEGQYPLSAEARTFPQMFQQAGYVTGAMGKWGLGPVGSTGAPNRKGFDFFFGYNCQSVAHSYYPSHLWRNADKIIINQKPIPGHATQPEGEVNLDDWLGETYAPSLIVAEAEQFIAANAARPFLLYLPFTQPHVAMHPPREAVEKFPEDWDPQVYRGQNGYLPHPRPRAAYAAMINELDAYVGRVVAAIEKAGLTGRTLVVFSSDNGATGEGRADPRFHSGGADPKFFHSTAGLRGFKGSVYEGGIRVPMIARFPGRIQAGAVNDTPSYFADWFPTLCDLVGIEKPDGLDGESLWPVVSGSQRSLGSRKPMIWVFPEYGGQVAVRIGDYKVVRQGLKTKNPGAWEVYNLSSDTAERHDLAGSHADVIQQAAQILGREVADNDRFPLSIPGLNDH